MGKVGAELMSKKTIKRKRNLEFEGIKFEKEAGFFSLIAAKISGTVQRIFLMIMKVAGKDKREATALRKSTAVTIDEVTAYTWDLGSSAGASGKIAGFNDKGYSNIFDGDIPLNDSSYDTFTVNTGATYLNNPLVSPKQGMDNKANSGTIDDYWVAYDEKKQLDPYDGSGTGTAMP